MRGIQSVKALAGSIPPAKPNLEAAHGGKAMDDVIREVASRRVGRLLTEKKPLRAETVAFWNGVVGHGA